VGSPNPAIESTSLERRMTKASAGTIAINDHEAPQVQHANGWQEVAESPLNFVSRFQPTTGAN
jgi:hypothetical protein